MRKRIEKPQENNYGILRENNHGEIKEKKQEKDNRKKGTNR